MWRWILAAALLTALPTLGWAQDATPAEDAKPADAKPADAKSEDAKPDEPAPVVEKQLVELTSGELLRAEVLERTDEKLVIEHAILGRVEIPNAKVKEVRADGPLKPRRPGTDTPPPPPSQLNRPEIKKPDEPEWKWKVSLGAQGETGNSETHNIRTAIEGLFENQYHRWRLLQTWDFEKSDGERTTNRFRSFILKDWMHPETRWLEFLSGQYEWDEFQEWDGRITIAGGVGYAFIKNDETTLNGRVGLTGVQETGVSDDKDDRRAELLLGGDWKWKISDSQDLKFDTILLPDLSDSGEYRVVSNFAWAIKFADSDHLSLQLGFRNEYDTHTERPFDKNEFEYFVAIVYEF